jgi:hypothetical protein
MSRRGAGWEGSSFIIWCTADPKGARNTRLLLSRSPDQPPTSSFPSSLTDLLLRSFPFKEYPSRNKKKERAESIA